MNAFSEIRDELVRANARSKAARDHEDAVRVKFSTAALERWDAEGQDRWVAPGLGVVSLCKPSPFGRVTDRDRLVKWLVENGHGDLVTASTTVADSQRLANVADGAVHAVKTGDGKYALELCELLVAAVEVVDEPVRDVWDQLWSTNRFVAVQDDTDRTLARMVASTGEVVPGLVQVTPEPSSVRVLPDRRLRERASFELLMDEADAEADGAA
jgi:hypothetical protein